jgi:hypothetical protein
MAANFKIRMFRNKNNLHLKLNGDFDGTAAHELLNILKSHSRGSSTIFINTDYLNRVYPFGQEIFRIGLNRLNGLSSRLVFTAANACPIAYEGGNF